MLRWNGLPKYGKLRQKTKGEFFATLLHRAMTMNSNHFRTPLAEIPPAECEKLSRTTKWRAKKRGWVVLNYHTERAHWSVNPAQNFNAKDAYNLAKKLVSTKVWGMAIPNYMDREDLIQECVIELWRVSAKAGYESQKWQIEVMCRHLKKMQAKCRGDKDKLNGIPFEKVYSNKQYH
jgi:hypothetical protein